MDRQEIYDLMNNNVGFHLATIDGGKPRVRGMMLYKAGPDGIIFHTGKFRDLYSQIVSNPNVELCFNDPDRFIQVRVSGALEILNDNNLKDEISNHPTRVFLQGWKNSISIEEFYDNFVVFRLQNGEATVWKMETNREPKLIVNL